MTARELINELKKYDLDAEVYFGNLELVKIHSVKEDVLFNVITLSPRIDDSFDYDEEDE